MLRFRFHFTSRDVFLCVHYIIDYILKDKPGSLTDVFFFFFSVSVISPSFMTINLGVKERNKSK